MARSVALIAYSLAPLCGGIKVEDMDFLTRATPACPKATTETRWRHVVKGSDIRPAQFGESYYLACDEDEHRIGSAVVQPRLNTEDPMASDFLITIDDSDSRLTYDKSNCKTVFVFEESEPKQCLVELEIPGPGIHLRRLIYTLPFGLGDGVRRSCIQLDSEASIVQDLLEIGALLVFILWIIAVRWSASSPTWAWASGGDGVVGADDFQPGTYRAGAELKIKSSPSSGGNDVGSVPLGTDMDVVAVEREGPAIWGKLEVPSPGWVQLRSGTKSRPELQESFVLGEAPPGLEVPTWDALFTNLMVVALGFAFTFTGMVVELVKLLWQLSPSKVLAWSLLGYSLLFGLFSIPNIWAKSCRYIAYQISLRHGKLFQAGSGSFSERFAFRLSVAGYAFLSMGSLYIINSSHKDELLEHETVAVLDYWTYLCMLFANIGCFIFFERCACEAQDGVIFMHLAQKAQEPGSTADIHYNVSFSVRTVQEDTLVAAGRSGSENLMQVREDHGVSYSFAMQDMPWFRSFITRHLVVHGSWTLRFARMWPQLVIFLLVYHTMFAIGVCMSHQKGSPGLYHLNELSGHLYPPFDGNSKELSLFVDKDATTIDLYAYADPAVISSLTFSIPGQDPVHSKDGNLLTHRDISKDLPQEVSYEVTSGNEAITYTLHVQPVFTVIRSVTLRGKVCEGTNCKSFDRCAPWSGLRSGSVAIPDKAQDLFLEVAITEHLLGVPVDKAQEFPGRTFTTYEAGSGSGCREVCDKVGNCIGQKSTEKGCYLVHVDEHSVCEVFESKAATSLAMQQPLGKVCRQAPGSPKRGDDCTRMSWVPEKRSFNIQLGDEQLNWNEKQANLLLGLNPRLGGGASSYALRLRQGPPELEVLLATSEQGIKPVVLQSSTNALIVQMDGLNGQQVAPLKLFLAPLVGDPSFQATLKKVPGAGPEPKEHGATAPFEGCKTKGADHFKVCGGEWPSKTFMLELDPVKDFGEFLVEITMVDSEQDLKGFFEPVRIPVRIMGPPNGAPVAAGLNLQASPGSGSNSDSNDAKGKDDKSGKDVKPHDQAETPPPKTDCTILNPDQVPKEKIPAIAQDCNSDQMEKAVSSFLKNKENFGKPAADVFVRLGLNKDFETLRKSIFGSSGTSWKLVSLIPKMTSLREFEESLREAKITPGTQLKTLEQDIFSAVSEEPLQFVEGIESLAEPEQFSFTAPVILKRQHLTDLVRVTALHARSEGTIEALAKWVGTTEVPSEPTLTLSDPLSAPALEALTKASKLFPTIGGAPMVFISNAELQKIQSEDCSEITDFLSSFTDLEHLSLSDKSIDLACAKGIGAERWGKLASKIKILKISENEINDEGAAVWATYLEKMPLLEQLDISKNVFGKDGASKLVESLKKSKTLKEIRAKPVDSKLFVGLPETVIVE